MKRTDSLRAVCLLASLITLSNSIQGMGIRSFVALPVEKGGAVGRLVYEHNETLNQDTLLASTAYGISATQTLLLGLPYSLSSQDTGEASILYRHQVWQQDHLRGTQRLGLLGGTKLPTRSEQEETTIQAGFVYTYFKGRHEIDVDALYLDGFQSKPAQGRYDLAWQYRLFPVTRPDWGLSEEIYGVWEFNGRWHEERGNVYQSTIGLQWVQPEWVVDVAHYRSLNDRSIRAYLLRAYLLGVRFHF